MSESIKEGFGPRELAALATLLDAMNECSKIGIEFGVDSRMDEIVVVNGDSNLKNPSLRLSFNAGKWELKK